jgi:hypothetical protein
MFANLKKAFSSSKLEEQFVANCETLGLDPLKVNAFGDVELHAQTLAEWIEKAVNVKKSDFALLRLILRTKRLDSALDAKEVARVLCYFIDQRVLAQPQTYADWGNFMLAPNGVAFPVWYCNHTTLCDNVLEFGQSDLDRAGWAHISDGRLDHCCPLTWRQKRTIKELEAKRGAPFTISANTGGQVSEWFNEVEYDRKKGKMAPIPLETPYNAFPEEVYGPEGCPWLAPSVDDPKPEPDAVEPDALAGWKEPDRAAPDAQRKVYAGLAEAAERAQTIILRPGPPFLGFDRSTPDTTVVPDCKKLGY